jgi:uncharacterized protein (TIRG00374 family)
VAAIRGIGLGEWLILIGVNGAVLLILNGRWWLILYGLGHAVPFFPLFGYRLASFGVSYFTPGPHFGGEPIQVILLEREQAVGRETAVASVALDKMMELLINFTFLLGGVLYLLQNGVVARQLGWEMVIYGLILLAIPAGLWWALWVGKRPFSTLIRLLNKGVSFPRRRESRADSLAIPQKWETTLQKIAQGVAQSEREMSRACRDAPRLMWGAFGLTLLSWVGIVFEYGLSLTFLGLSLTFNQILLLLIAARIAILLPLPAGLGTLESSQVLGLGMLGLETAVGVSITLVIRARDVLLGLIGVWWGWYKLSQSNGKNV